MFVMNKINLINIVSPVEDICLTPRKYLIDQDFYIDMVKSITDDILKRNAEHRKKLDTILGNLESAISSSK